MKTLILHISLFSLLISFAQTPETYFKQGNEAYKKGDYQAAVTAYEKALQSDKTAAELFFNLGNAYYKLNRIAPSVYYYEKALKLSPGDEDIRYNLQLANQMKLDKIDKVPESFLFRVKKSVNSLFNYNTWGWLAVLSAFSGLFVFVLFLFTKGANTKRLSFVAMFISLFLLIFSWYNAGFGYRQSQVQHGIIFSQKVDLMTEPNLTSDQVTTLHEGSKVKIIKTDADWFLVELPNGKKAWLPKSDIKVIN